MASIILVLCEASLGMHEYREDCRGDQQRGRPEWGFVMDIPSYIVTAEDLGLFQKDTGQGVSVDQDPSPGGSSPEMWSSWQPIWLACE